MDIAEINSILEKAPAVISYRAEQENKAYALMLNLHEKYKQLRAEKYLTTKAKGETTIKDIEYMLDSDSDLIRLKSEEISAEIDYRKWRVEKNRAMDKFEACKNVGYNLRCEIKGLSDTVNK